MHKNMKVIFSLLLLLLLPSVLSQVTVQVSSFMSISGEGAQMQGESP